MRNVQEKKQSHTKFTKADLKQENQLQSYKDVLEAVLKEDESYGIQDVMDKIDQFMKGKVR